MKIYYVYEHYTADTNELFYIGKGKKRRAFEERSRNRYWKNIVEKHGFIVKFIATDISEEEALELEIKYIMDKKPKCNMTRGGQGTSGYVFDEELVRKRNKANKDLYLDKEWVEKRRKNLIAAMARAEVREKIAIAKKRRNDEIASGLRPKRNPKVHSAETIKKISDKQKGEKGYWFGKKTTVAIAVTNLNTNEIFDTLKDAAKSVNGSYRPLSKAIKLGKTYKKQMFKYVKDK